MAPLSRRWLSRGRLSLVDFGLPVELGQAQHRHLQFAGQPLEPAGDLGHLLLPRIFRVVRLDQLQVVDHDQAQPALALQPAGGGGDFGDRAAGRVVDEQRRLAQFGRLFHQLGGDRRWRSCRCAAAGR